jgi:hypothetical protein
MPALIRQLLNLAIRLLNSTQRRLLLLIKKRKIPDLGSVIEFFIADEDRFSARSLACG